MFTWVETPVLCTFVSCVEALLQNAMYGVIYSYSPQLFPVRVRGTAIGVASSLGRVLGALCPMLTGYLVEIEMNLALYMSSALIIFTSVLMALQPAPTEIGN